MTLPDLTRTLREAGLWPDDRPLPLLLRVREYRRITGEGEKSIRADCKAGRIPNRVTGRRGFVMILTQPALSAFFANGAISRS